MTHNNTTNRWNDPIITDEIKQIATKWYESTNGKFGSIRSVAISAVADYIARTSKFNNEDKR